jgi:hypothetical protein
MRQFVVRAAPVSGVPVLFDALSRHNGRLSCIMGNETKEVGLDFYMASTPVDPEYAHKIIQAYAKHVNMDETAFSLRQRLPMNGPVRKSRALNNADTNSAAAANDSKKEGVKKGEPDFSAQTLEARVQQFHDSQTRKGDEQKEHPKQEEKKATAEGAHGAVVKRTDEGKKAAKQQAEKAGRRKYTKKPAQERSAKSKAAYERYVRELSNQIEQHPELIKPATPGEGVTQEQVDEETLKFAMKLAKLLKGVM